MMAFAGIEYAQIGQRRACLWAAQWQQAGIDHVHTLGAAEVQHALRIAVATAAVVFLIRQPVASA